MEKKALPEGWYYATSEESKALWIELQKELPPGHLLFEKPIKVIAHRDEATDDILCEHIDKTHHYTVIHLTWSMSREVDERHPTVEMDGSFEDFLEYEKSFGR